MLEALDGNATLNRSASISVINININLIKDAWQPPTHPRNLVISMISQILNLNYFYYSIFYKITLKTFLQKSDIKVIHSEINYPHKPMPTHKMLLMNKHEIYEYSHYYNYAPWHDKTCYTFL